MHRHVWLSTEAEEDVGCSGTGVIDDYKPPCGCLGIEPGSSGRGAELLTTEPSFQPYSGLLGKSKGSLGYIFSKYQKERREEGEERREMREEGGREGEREGERESAIWRHFQSHHHRIPE